MVAIYCYLEREKLLKMSGVLMKGKAVLTKIIFIELFIYN